MYVYKLFRARLGAALLAVVSNTSAASLRALRCPIRTHLFARPQVPYSRAMPRALWWSWGGGE